MKLFLLSLAILCWFACGVADEADEKTDLKLPEGIPTCPQNDKNLNKCLKSVFQDMLPRLVEGNKELNIPPIDPFALGKNTYEYRNGGLQGRFSIKNTNIFGLSKTIFRDVRLTIRENGTHLVMDTFVPKVLVEGSYKADVKFNEIKLNPRGYFNVSVSDISVLMIVDGEFFEKDSHRYIRLVKYNPTVDIGKLKVYATGLFPDPTLNAIVLDFINQYWPELYKAALPETRVYWEPFTLNILNEFLQTFPFDSFLVKN